MIVGEFPRRDLARRLADTGLRLRTGPVVNTIQTRLAPVVQGVARHYADYPVEESESFADFHVRVGPPHSLRRWLKPQVLFQVDGTLPFKPLPAAQAFAMLEWGLNWCVTNQCHQYLIVHAAAVEKSGCALVLPGPPGSGKSTLCAGLVSRGWRLLSDELTLLDLATGHIVPLPRPVSLKNDSIDAIRRYYPGAELGPAVHDTAKGSVAHMKPPAESVRRATETARPRWVAMPRYEHAAAAQLERLSKARTFIHLADNAFNYDVHGRRGFELLSQVIAGCDCFEFRYGALEDAVAVFDEIARRP
jgi:HprK-related kinase A